jgi:2-desacetyl-2-hydroxyethyl bacteriochlorophyllide A dehydrogenase
MKAAVITAPGAIEIADVADPTPGRGDVVVEVAAVGLCGTDLHILAGEHGTIPVVPGHEVSGTVVAVGADASGVAVGDRVAVDPSLPCRACTYCRRGRANLCLTLGALGVTTAGGAARFMTAPASACVRLPDHVELRSATLIEPLSCVVRGYDVLRSQLGASVLVYGAGTMGLMLAAMAARVGALSVDVVEVNEAKRALAGAVATGSVAAAADELDRGDGWDLVIDATGNAAAIQDGVGRVGRGGTLLQFGVASPAATVTINPYLIYNHEITVTGSMAVLHSFERAAELFAAGVIDPDVFITGRYPLGEYRAALDNFAAGHGLKTQVVPA